VAAIRRSSRQSPRAGARLGAAVAAFLILAVGAACGGDDGEGGGAAGSLSGWIHTDGSSTVDPFTALAAERFQRRTAGVRITRSIVPTGTGGGFERFCAGETDLSYASRPINEDEAQACRMRGIQYTAFRIANDAVTIVVNRRNDWADCLTTGDLQTIWQPGSTIDSWSEVRSGFPAKQLELFGPGPASGTFDYFTAEIVGEEGASRSDYLGSEDHNFIARDVARAEGGLGYLGLAHFTENAGQLKALAIDAGSGCVVPSVAGAQEGEYPLSRPLFIYAKNASLRRPHVRGFVEYALEIAVSLAEDALLVPLTDEQLRQEQAKFDEAVANDGS
jgi:phosphate transport system substrate-binding protein